MPPTGPDAWYSPWHIEHLGAQYSLAKLGHCHGQAFSKPGNRGPGGEGFHRELLAWLEAEPELEPSFLDSLYIYSVYNDRVLFVCLLIFTQG